MFAEVRVRYGPNYANFDIVNSLKDLAFDAKYGDVGAFNFTVKQTDPLISKLTDQAVIEIAPNGQSGYNLWYAIDGSTGTKTADDTLWKTVSGKSIVNWLTDAVVYPSAWPNISPSGGPLSPGQTTALAGHAFNNATPGFILRTLIARAQQRGALLWLDATSFTGPTTTDGHAWASTLTVTYNNGQSYLQVLQDLANQGLISFRMSGMQLQVFNLDATVVHHSPEEIIFRRGKTILEQSTNTDSSIWASAVLYQGDQNIAVEGTSAAALAAIGRRREYYASTGGITDQPTLGLLAQQELLFFGHLNSEETIGVTDTIQPWVAPAGSTVKYDVGDWVWEDRGDTGLVNLQIKQIAATGQDENDLKVGLTLGDILDDLNSKIQRKLNAITGANSGSSGGLPNTGVDYMPPAAPTGIAVSPTPYADANGVAHCQVTITWNAPTTNLDGTAVTDLDHYDIQYIVVNPAPYPLTNPTSPWSTAVVVTAPNAVGFLSGLPCGSQLTVQVRAVDQSGNASNWDTAASIKLPNLVVTPATPSTPIVTGTFQALRIQWDGLDVSGAVMPTTWARTEIHISTTSGFTPTSGTLAGAFTSDGGIDFVAESGYTTTYYVKLLTVDKQGNISAPSAQASASPAQLSDPDLPAQLVTGAKIASGTINASNLTVAAFGDSVTPNGSFEDAATAASDTAGAAGWVIGAGTSSSVARDSTSSATGGWAMKLASSGSTVARVRSAFAFPASYPDIWYVTSKIMFSRALTNIGTLLDVFLEFSADGTFTDMTGASAHLTTNIATTSFAVFEGQLSVPLGAKQARYNLQLAAPSDAAAITVYVDDVAVRPVVGNAWIANASINNAKIANVSADKITVGTLSADVTVSARIKTSDTGPRVEMNSAGIQSYDAQGNQTLNVDDTTGNVTLTGALQGGSIDLPGAGTSASFRFHADSAGVVASGNGVINLITDPSFEGSPSVTAKDSHTAPLTAIGSYYSSESATPRSYAAYGDKCLVISGDATDNYGWVELTLATVNPSTLYCFSMFVGYPFNDVGSAFPGPGKSFYFDPTSFLGRAGATNLFSGYDGYFALDTTISGYRNFGPSVPPSPPIAAGNTARVLLWHTYAARGTAGQNAIQYIGAPGYNMVNKNGASMAVARFYKAFVTPSTIAAGSSFTIRLPAPYAYQAQHQAIGYDGLMLEQGVLVPSAYTDGGILGCKWTSTPRASSSQRGAGVLLSMPAGSPPTFPYGIGVGTGNPHGMTCVSMSRTSSTLALPYNTVTVLTWDTYYDGQPAAGTATEHNDDGQLWQGSSDAASFVTPVDGWYSMSLIGTFPAVDTGGVSVTYQRSFFDIRNPNTGEIYCRNNNPTQGEEIVSTSAVKYLTAGTTLRCYAYQSNTAGHAVNLQTHTALSPADVTINLIG